MNEQVRNWFFQFNGSSNSDYFLYFNVMSLMTTRWHVKQPWMARWVPSLSNPKAFVLLWLFIWTILMFGHNCSSLDIIWQDRMKILKSTKKKIISPLLSQVLTIRTRSVIVTTGCMQDIWGHAQLPYLIMTLSPPYILLRKEYK